MQAQQPVSIHLTEKDGLPDNEFYNVLEDSKGYIWLAADSGLYRYDGKTYTQYTNSEKRGLSVFELKEDAFGRVWCTNISGQFFYVENNKLITFVDLKDELKGQLAGFSLQQNHLVVNTHRNIYAVDLKTKKVSKRVDGNAGLSNVLRVKDKLVFVNFYNIVILNEKLQKTKEYKINIKEKVIDRFGKAIKQGKTVFFNINNSFFISQQYKSQNIFKSINLENGEVFKVNGFEALKDKRIIETTLLNNNLWVSTYSGIYIYENYKNEFKLKKHILKDEIVTKVITDKDENYWITTLANGIYLIPNIAVINYSLSKDLNDITVIDKVNDSILFFGSKTGKVGLMNINSSTYKTSSQLNSKVSAIQYNSQKEYSYVSTDNKAYFVDNKTLKATYKRSLSGVKSFSRINKNTTVYGTYANFFFFDERTNSSKKKLKQSRVYTTHYNESRKSLFVGYVNSLIAYDSIFKPTNIRYNGNEILALSISETEDGVVWVATFKNGIFAISNNKVIRHYTTKNGLLSNQTKYVKADGNQLWVASSKGLQVFDSNTKAFKNLTKSDGVLSYKISGIEVLDNHIVISSNKGVFSFDKSKVFKTNSKPQIYFDNIKINEKSVNITTDYNLYYNQNSIEFGFNVNGIFYNQNKTYQYRLLGYNDNWITTDLGVNTIKYNSLPAGNYIFEVKPTDKNIIKSIKLNIELPFWKQWWFILTYSLLIVGLIVLYYRWKLKREEKVQQIEVQQLLLDRELTNLKLENLRSQMNPHFVFNALNSIQEYIFSNQKNLAGDYLGKFADLMRTYLEHSHTGKITLEEEINTLSKYLELEKLRFEDTFKYNIISEKELDIEGISIPTMLIQPYVENALKHGLLHIKDNRKLTVTISKISLDLIECIVEDNGVGREKSKKINKKLIKSHKSFGLKATTKRLDLLNYGRENKIGVDIEDLHVNDKAIGTKVVLTIPIINA